MSDIDRLVAAARDARRFTVQLRDGARLTLQEPTHHELQLLTVRTMPDGGEVGLLAWSRELALHAIVGWEGVVEADLLVPGVPDQPAPAVAFDAALVELLLDAQPGLTERVRGELLARVKSTRDRAEAAQKN